tara:strand:- start:4349 stop:5563 length:1215 start_codon:yes stop_codon:yes gene_type:complete
MSDSNPWLSVVGIGDSGLDSLTPVAKSALDAADVIFGGKRHLAHLGNDQRNLQSWSSPFSDSIERVLEYRGQTVVILATGNPLWFGAGSALIRSVSAEEIRFYPTPSAYSLAAARLGWPIEDTFCLTVHGRRLESLIPFITPNQKLLVLCHNGGSPGEIAKMLNDRGYGDSVLTALSHMDGQQETVLENNANEWHETDLPHLTTLAVHCIAGQNAMIASTTPGLPDQAFEHDGKITKREVRAATVSALAPLPGQFLWDVGAGSGSVAIEWCRATKGATASAIEQHQDRLGMIRNNALALGTPNLEIVAGSAPDALNNLSHPDAIFIGGGVSTDGVVEACWDALLPQGRLVANAVTIEGESRLIAAQETYGGELVRFAISRAEAVGSFQGWKPMMPVTQWRVAKK